MLRWFPTTSETQPPVPLVKLPHTSRRIVFAFAAFCPFVYHSSAATYNWQTAGTTNIWSSAVGDTNWFIGGTAPLAPWTDGNDAVLSGSGEAITLSGTVLPTSLAVGAGNGSWSLNGSGSSIGSGTLTKTGTGEFSIENNIANAFSAVALNGGTLRIKSNNLALGTANITVGANSTLATQSGSEAVALTNTASIGTGLTFSLDGGYAALTMSGIISGAGGIAKASIGTVALNGANTYAGGTTTNAGTLSVGNATGLGTGALTFTGSSALSIANDIAVANPISIGSGLTATLNGSGYGSRLTGAISGAGAVNVSYYNSFTGANTYTGGTTISSYLGVTGDGALGAVPATFSPSNITLNGGSLGTYVAGFVYNVTLNANRGILLGASGGTLDVNTSSMTVNGVISGTGNLSKSTGGSLFLNGLNTYTGKTNFNDGTLTISSLKNVGDVTGSSLGNPATVANGTIGLGSNASTANLVYTGTGNTTDRVINLNGTTGAVSISQSGVGLLKFTSPLTATGAGSKTLTLQGSTNGTGELAGAIVNNSATNLTSLTKAGTGTWTLSGPSTYTGPTTVNGGRLNVTGSLTSATTVNTGGSISGTGSTTGSLTMNAGSAFALTGGATTTSLTANGVTLAGATSIVSSSPLVNGTVYDVVTYGAGGLTGIANLSTAGYRGGIVDTGTKITLTADVGTRTWNTTTGTWDIGTTANFAEGDQKFFTGDSVVFGNIPSNSTVTMSGRLMPGSVAVSNAANSYTLTGVAGTSDLTGSAALTKTGAGTLILPTANTYTGGTAINGGIISTGLSTSVGTGPISFNGGSLAVTANGQTFSQPITLGSSGGTVDSSALAGTGLTTTLSGFISGTGGLTLKATGNLSATGGGDPGLGIRLSNAVNTYVGDTTITAGLVSYASDASFGNSANKIILNGGGLLDNNANIPLAHDIQVLAGGGTFRGYGSINSTWSGSITGTGAINRTDGGTLTLAGNLSGYSGTYSNQGGTTNLTGTAATIGGNWAITANSVTVNSAANQTLAGVVSGAGTLIKSGAGTLLLTNANTMANTTVNAGILQAGNSTATNKKMTLNGGALTISNGVTLNMDSGLTFASNTNASVSAASGTAALTAFDVNSADIVVNTGVTATIASSVNVTLGTYGFRIDNTGDLTMGGVISGAGGANNAVNLLGQYVGTDTGSLYKLGTGTLTLTGANTFTGGGSVASTTLQNGTLKLSGGNNRLPATSAVYLGATTTSGKLVLDGVSQTITGLKNVGTGTANAVVGGSVTTSTLTVNNTNSYSYGGTIGGVGTNENNISLAKTGIGSLTLTAANLFTGATVISGGTLELTAPSSLGATSSITINSGGSLLLSGITTTDRISNSASMILAGGSISFAGGASEGSSPGTGPLMLNATSIIDFANGNSMINFASSAATTWTTGATLKIFNWDGLEAGGGNDRLLFGTDSSGLTSEQLAQINFYSGSTEDTLIGTGKFAGATAEIVAVPETSIAVLTGLLGLGCLLRRKR